MAQATLDPGEIAAPRSRFWKRWLGRSGADRDRPLDTQVQIVTPENIEFAYFVAGPVPRGLAFLVDLLMWCLVYLALVLAAVMVMGFAVAPALRYLALDWLLELVLSISAGLFLLAWFLGYWFYWGLCEAKFNGRTPGKALVGLRVVSTSGHPISGWQAMVRTFVRGVEAMPTVPTVLIVGIFWGDAAGYDYNGEPTPVAFVFPTFLVALIVMTVTGTFQRLGDLVSNTLVVYEHRGWKPGLAVLEDERTPRLAEFIPPGFRVSREMARALASYVHKRRYLTPARRKDIAAHLAVPLLQRWGLPLDTSYDLLMCALYYRVFVAEAQQRADLGWVAEPDEEGRA